MPSQKTANRVRRIDSRTPRCCRRDARTTAGLLRRRLGLSTRGYGRDITGHAALPRVDLLAVFKAGQAARDDGARRCQASKPLAHQCKWQPHLFCNLQIEPLAIFLQAFQGFDHCTCPRLRQREKASNCRSTTSRPSPRRRLQTRQDSSCTRPRTRSIDTPGGTSLTAKYLKELAPRPGLEPRTYGLRRSGGRFAIMNHNVTKSNLVCLPLLLWSCLLFAAWRSDDEDDCPMRFSAPMSLSKSAST